MPLGVLRAVHQTQVTTIKACFEGKGCLPCPPRAPCRRVIAYLPVARRGHARLGAPAVAMPGFGLLLATTAVAVLAFGAVINRARAAYARFDALLAPEDDQSVSVDDVLRTVWCWVLTVLLVPVSSVSWHVFKWFALTGRLILHELVQNIWFAFWLVSLPLRCVSQFMVALQQIFWSTPRPDAGKRLRAEQPGANLSNGPHKSPNLPSAAKFLPLRGANCSALRRTISFMGGRRAEKAAGKNEKYKKHAARRGGSGTQGAVAQFSTGRRCGNWQCTGRLWSSGFAAAPHSKRAGVA